MPSSTRIAATPTMNLRMSRRPPQENRMSESGTVRETMLIYLTEAVNATILGS
jgi:hypothetical protein